jgi:hypothetical protein
MKTLSGLSVRWMRVLTVLCAGILWSSTAPAQPAADTINGRFLLIFDTSSAMKSRVPATQYAVERLFLSMMNGQLHPEDGIGVWAFDRKLRAGQLPLQRWVPQDAATIASKITNFVIRQHYSRSARFDVIMPAVNNLVRNSQRLTVLIFCDGSEQITGTPYDEAINSSFKHNQRALANAKATFIVVLRGQSGQYTGYSVNSSEVGVNFPEFPPLPAPPEPVAAPQINQPPPRASVPASPPAPVVKLPPLVIVGTNVSSNPLPPVPAKAKLLKPPPAKVASASLPKESLPGSANAAPSKVAGGSTNAVAPAAENSGLSRQDALVTGAVLLAAAVLVIILGLIRSRNSRDSSLITRSMNRR